MSNPLSSSLWDDLQPRVNVNDEQELPESNKRWEYLYTSHEIGSRDRPIYCSIASPAPSFRNSVISLAPSSSDLAVQVIDLETPRSSLQHSRPPRLTLQVDPDREPLVEFHRNDFPSLSQSPKKEDISGGRKSQSGPGIQDASFGSNPSPIMSSAEEELGGEIAEKRPTTFAQQVLQRSWKSSTSGNFIKRWQLEIICWLLSAACMTGIVVMLVIYKDDRIPKWPQGLTLNAYISILSKIASAALTLPVAEAIGQLKWGQLAVPCKTSNRMWDFEIFDKASRGPWGCLLLLMHTKGKSLAALGAAMTLFALAIDPFFQQVVEYPEHWRLQEGNGSIPRAFSYNRFISNKEFQAGRENTVLDYNMLGVAHQFFFDNGTLPITFGKHIRAEIPLACPNSNCTWPEYETLGICNKCIDAMELLEFRCINATLDWVQVPDEDNEGTRYNVDRDTAHTGEILIERAQPLYDIFTRSPLPGLQSRLNISRSPLAHAVFTSGGSLYDIRQNATPKAHECIFSWCVKTMLSTYSEGGYTENVTKIIVNDTLGPLPWLKMHNKNGRLSSTKYIYTEDIIVKGDSGFNFQVDNYTHVLTLSIFDDILPSTYTLINSTYLSDAMLRYKESIHAGPATRNVTYNPFLYDNITTHLDNLATAMTNKIRSAATMTEMIKGLAYGKESFVDVRWPWLGLPLGLLGVTFIFLAATITRTIMEQDSVGVWKSSAIAALLYGLPDDIQHSVTSESATAKKETKSSFAPRTGRTFSGSDLSPASLESRPPSPFPEWI